MCGLAGLLTSREWSSDKLGSSAQRMSDALIHRGPDDEGVWTDAAAGVALGFRRLSIVDLSASGHQPMRSASGRFTLVFNGEVYNHRELRLELQKHGARFEGHSDTEVLLAAFERWGVEESVRHFVGMFAIAVWDAELRRLHLIRDRLGIKPLYVYWRRGLFLFASELKAMVELPEFDGTLDFDALAAYFRHLYVPAPHTAYRYASKLLPGHMLSIDSAREEPPDSVPYWSMADAARAGMADPWSGSIEEAIETLDSLVASAVQPRMQADVPLGAFLSGGIDSSLVVAHMQTASDRPVRTFSIAFEEESYDEAAHAARVATQLQTDHTELTLTAEDTRAVVPRLAEIFDEPFASSSAIPNFLVCELARRDVTVALSGTGGDEVFAGYNRYTYGERLLESAGRIPHPMRRLAAAGIDSLSADTWDRLYGVARRVMPGESAQVHAGTKIRKVGEVLSQASRPDMYRSLVSSWRDPSGLVLGGTERRGRLEAVLESDMEDCGWLQRILLADQLTYLPGDQLTKIDRVSMAVSLEVRVPLLDHRLAEFSWRLPESLLRRGSEGKWLLRQALFRRLPRELVDRPKMGLSVPIEEWLRGPLKGWAEELLDRSRLEREGLLSADAVRAAWRAFQRGHGSALEIWTVIMFQAWVERWVN